MPDKPIIFSAPMVLALLDGRKTQTRRVLKPQPAPALPIGGADFVVMPGERGSWCWLNGWDGSIIDRFRVPYAPGDRLYVREAWSHAGAAVWTIADARRRGRGGVLYRADHEEADAAGPRVDAKWWPSIHMPRGFSRLTLTVTEVRVQRLQEISEEDAMAEGIEPTEPDDPHPFGRWKDYCGVADYFLAPENSFMSLWNSLYGPDAWAANPWVAAISFTVEKRNIDEAPHA